MAFASLRRLAGEASCAPPPLAASNAFAAGAPQPDGTVDMAKVLAPGRCRT